MSSKSASKLVAISRLPRRQRGRDRVASLMASAAGLFVEKGYDATTMTEIAARAGASIGSLYLFFPTKQALAQAMAAELADLMSDRIGDLHARTEGAVAADIADALFGELALFLGEHPVYAALIDLPGDEEWRGSIRGRRRSEIAALLAQAEPTLPAGQSERLAAIIPQLMRVALTLGAEGPHRTAILEELRLMLRHHLDRRA